MARTSQFEATYGRRPRIVIVGGGFGGIVAAKRLAKLPVDIALVDKRNYHLFQPLLYQVATADLSPADIAWPIRGVFTHRRNVTCVLAKVTGVDTVQKLVITDSCEPLPYDFLVLASGAQHSYFGRDEWAAVAPGLKRIIDATEIRKRVLVAFERAELASTEAERRRQLTFVIVGGGPTGVEMSGSIAELARFALARDFRKIDPKSARVILVEAGPRLLPAFRETCSAYTKRTLEKMGVEVLVGCRVTGCDETGVTIDSQIIPAATIIWGAGVAASPAARWLGVAPADRAGRVPVGPDLSVPGLDTVFAIGDTADSKSWNGKPAPGIAPAAKQGGAHVAKIIAHRIGLGRDPGPFVYKHLGNLATIGRNAAIVDFGPVRFSGFLGWLIWSSAHILFLISVRSALFVGMSWAWAYLTYRRGARLITGLQPLIEPPTPATPTVGGGGPRPQPGPATARPD